jgi:ryanodine receptor 2
VSEERYVPAPIDTEDVELSEEIMELCELLAKNTHEVWSETRIRDGWSYGEARDDVAKKHPCLVPYEHLSESEKEYDRNTSIQTLKLIQKLGFSIKKQE